MEPFVTVVLGQQPIIYIVLNAVRFIGSRFREQTEYLLLVVGVHYFPEGFKCVRKLSFVIAEHTAEFLGVYYRFNIAVFLVVCVP